MGFKGLEKEQSCKGCELRNEGRGFRVFVRTEGLGLKKHGAGFRVSS